MVYIIVVIILAFIAWWTFVIKITFKEDNQDDNVIDELLDDKEEKDGR